MLHDHHAFMCTNGEMSTYEEAKLADTRHPSSPQGEPRMIKGSDLFVSALENEGVDRIFGVAGEELLGIWESLRKSKIKLVKTRTEWGAVLMAAAHYRLTGRTGVCIATCGPGALNFANGAGYALLGGFSVVMITGEKPIKSTPQAGFQSVDARNVMKQVTKLARQIGSSRLIPTMVREAFRVAQEEKPGPVHLVVPEDIAAEECQEVEL